MTDDEIIRMLVLSWLGFSLAFFVASCTWRFSVLGGMFNLKGKDIAVRPTGFAIRFVLSVCGLTGAVATAAFVGLAIRQVEGAAYIFLLGIGLGIGVSIMLYPWYAGRKSK